jgi:hypothetical protein
VRRKDFDDMLKEARVRQDKILRSKGDDYTIDNAEADRLYNFKEIAELTGLKAEQVWGIYFLKHIFSILAHIKGEKESEPIIGRIDDAINYLYLYMGLVYEKNDEVDADLWAKPVRLKQGNDGVVSHEHNTK